MEELNSRTIGPTIQLKVELSAMSSTFLADPAQVENPLLNLCINARDALEGGVPSPSRRTTRSCCREQSWIRNWYPECTSRYALSTMVSA